MSNFLCGTWQDIRELPTGLAKDRDALSVIILTLVPWCILIVRKPDLNDLQLLAGFLGFLVLYWLVFHRQSQKPIMVKKPRLEIAVALGLPEDYFPEVRVTRAQRFLERDSALADRIYDEGPACKKR